MRGLARAGALLLAFLPLSLLPAQSFTEERVRIRHLEPSILMERINLLAGLPRDQAGRIQLRADDASDTIVIRIPQDYGDPLEREQLRLTLREYLTELDRPQPQVDLFLYLVQSNLLTEQEFRALDEQLREGPMRIEAGVSPKGVVMHDAVRAESLSMVTIDRTQAEAAAMTRPEPVRLQGRILPAVQTDGRVYLAAMLTAEAMERPFANSQTTLQISDRAVPASNQPLIFVAGEKMPLIENSQEPFPGRHEIMLYVWAQPLPTQP